MRRRALFLALAFLVVACNGGHGESGERDDRLARVGVDTFSHDKWIDRIESAVELPDGRLALIGSVGEAQGLDTVRRILTTTGSGTLVDADLPVLDACDAPRPEGLAVAGSELWASFSCLGWQAPGERQLAKLVHPGEWVAVADRFDVRGAGGSLSVVSLQGQDVFLVSGAGGFCSLAVPDLLPECQAYATLEDGCAEVGAGRPALFGAENRLYAVINPFGGNQGYVQRLVMEDAHEFACSARFPFDGVLTAWNGGDGDAIGVLVRDREPSLVSLDPLLDIGLVDLPADERNSWAVARGPSAVRVCVVNRDHRTMTCEIWSQA